MTSSWRWRLSAAIISLTLSGCLTPSPSASDPQADPLAGHIEVAGPALPDDSQVWTIRIWTGALEISSGRFGPGSTPFISESVDEGAYVIRAQDLRGSFPGCARNVDVVSGRVTHVVFAFDPIDGCSLAAGEGNEPTAAALTGRVVQAEEGSRARLVPIEPRTAPAEQPLDEGGHFAFTGLLPGTYELQIVDSGIIVVRRRVTLSAGEDQALDLVVDR